MAARPLEIGPKLSRSSYRRLLLSGPRLGAELRRALRRERPYDILLLHFKKEQLLTLALPRSLRATCVWAEWGPLPAPLRKGAANLVYRWAARRAEIALAVSEGTRATLVAAGVEERKAFVLPNAVRVEEHRYSESARRRLRKQLGIAKDAFVIGTLTRLHTKKRNDVLVEAAERLEGDVHLIIAGEGESEDELRRLARPLGARAHFLPSPGQEAANVISAFDLAVFCPSPTEGAPLSVILPMLCGRPVVATGAEGACDLLPPGCGLILEPENDVSALTEALAGYQHDPDRRAREGEAARKHAEAHALGPARGRGVRANLPCRPHARRGRMRILVISNLYPPAVRGGYEVECAGVVEHLREQGDEVTVLTSRLGRTGASEKGVLRLLPFLSQTPRGALRAPLASISAARTTRKTIESVRPELIFAWNCAQIPHSAVYAALDSGVPTTFRVCEHWFGRLFNGDQFARHLYPGDRGLRRIWAALLRATNRNPALRIDPGRTPFPVAISWNSRFIRDAAPAPRLLEPAFESVVRSTSLNYARFAAIVREPADTPLLCYVGRLSSEKGPHVAVNALARLRDRHGVNAELVFAGPASASERRSVAREAEALGVGERCRMVGRLEPDDLCKLLARSHVLVVPSLWAEPFPLVTIEGALARVPIVASRTGGIPEQLEDGDRALLFPPGDANACAEAIAEVLLHPDEAAARAARALERASSLSWENYLRETDGFISGALAALAH